MGFPENRQLVQVFSLRMVVQYPVIYTVLSHLNRCNSFSRCHAIVVENRRTSEDDDLPILVTSRSGTLPMLSSKVNNPATHGSAR